MKKQPYELEGKDLADYRRGWHDGNEGRYYPVGHDEKIYAWGNRDGQKYGPRKGKPRTAAENLRDLSKLKLGGAS